MSEQTTAEGDIPVWCSEHMEPYCPHHIKPVGAHWADRWVALWYRLTYCTRHGHYKTAYTGDVQQCLNCGARVTTTPGASS